MWRGLASTVLTTVSVGSQLVLEIVDQIIDGVPDSTIERIVGAIKINPAANALNVFYRTGLVVVTDDAMAAGAVPDPFADPASWLWESSGALITDSTTKPDSGVVIPIDVRSRRRLRQEDMSLAFVIENLAGSGADMTIFQHLKVLLRVP